MKNKTKVIIGAAVVGVLGYFVATQEGRDALKLYEQHYVCGDRSLNYYLSNEITTWHYEQRIDISREIAKGSYFGVNSDSMARVHENNTKRKAQIEYIRKETVKEFNCLALWEESHV